MLYACCRQPSTAFSRIDRILIPEHLPTPGPQKRMPTPRLMLRARLVVTDSSSNTLDSQCADTKASCT